jgi:hypothetical protein
LLLKDPKEREELFRDSDRRFHHITAYLSASNDCSYILFLPAPANFPKEAENEKGYDSHSGELCPFLSCGTDFTAEMLGFGRKLELRSAN